MTPEFLAARRELARQALVSTSICSVVIAVFFSVGIHLLVDKSAAREVRNFATALGSVFAVCQYVLLVRHKDPLQVAGKLRHFEWISFTLVLGISALIDFQSGVRLPVLVAKSLVVWVTVFLSLHLVGLHLRKLPADDPLLQGGTR
mgnify:FL=1